MTTLCTNAYEEQLINPGLDTVSYVYTGLEKWLEEEAMTTEPSITTNRADMVIDIFHGTRIGQSISDVFGKVNDFISSFAGK